MANYSKKVEDKKEVEVVETSVDQVVAETPKVEARTKRKTVDKNLEVACRSVVSGELIYISRRTNEPIEWEDYGDIQYITVEDLNTMKSQQKAFLTKPWIIIEDEDVIDHLGLRSIYEGILPIEDLEAFLLETDINELVQAVRKAPKGIKELLVDKAREMVADERLDSMRTIKALNVELNIDLTMVQD